MTDFEKTKEQLVAELTELRERLAKTTRAGQTERKAVEEELAIFRQFVDAAGQGFGMGDLNSQIAYVNPAFCHLCGEDRPEDMIGKSFLSYYPESWKQRRSNEVIPLLEKTGHWTGEQALLTKQGKLIPTLQDAFLLRDETGKALRRCVVVTDITERKLAEDNLRKSEERFRSYFEQGLMGMAVSNRQMQWIEVNDRFCEILGYSKEEVLQRKITDFVHPDDLEAFREAYGRVLTGKIGHYTVNRRYIRKDGKVIYLHIFVKVFCSADGVVDHFLALFHDVTERIQAEKEIRELNRKLIVTLESITDGFVFLNQKWQYDYVNEAAARYLQKTRDEMLGSVCWDLFPEAKKTKIFTEFYRAVHENVPVHFEEFYPPLNVWYECHCYPSPEGLSVYFRDITERKLSEEALRSDHRTLQHLLQSSDHERQTIAYEIHDGLAQYLAGSLMQFQTYDHLKESKRELAKKAYEAAMTMLQQSHYEARRLIAGVRPPVLDEAGVVEAIAHLINEHNREKGPIIRFHSEVQFSRLVSILENAIYRICQEGLSNACKHSQSPKVRVRLLQRNDRIRIEIRDWGKGFTPREVKDDCYGLTGIRERARLLGGKFRIQTTAGKGTRIQVELPLMERAE